jgi:hypothetical protein
VGAVRTRRLKHGRWLLGITRIVGKAQPPDERRLAARQGKLEPLSPLSVLHLCARSLCCHSNDQQALPGGRLHRTQGGDVLVDSEHEAVLCDLDGARSTVASCQEH